MSAAKTPSFSLTLESPDPCRRIIKVTVPRAEYERQYEQRLTRAVRGHQRPGFRKGKTPRAIVEKELGGRLRVDTVEALVPQAYRAAVIEHRLHPLTEPELSNLAFADDQDLTFDLAVEVKPEVTAQGYEGLRVTERAIDVSDQDVDEVLERLRDGRGFYEPAARAAAAGDRVLLDLVPLDADGAADEARRAVDQRVTVGAETNLPAFNEALPGAQAGDTRDVTVTYPDAYPNPDLQGRTVTFRAEVKAVEQKVLPALDDAFAAQLDEGQTLLELRARIREGLTAEARQRAAEDLDAQILEQLIAANDVPVPPSMVEAWLQSGLQEQQRRHQHAGRPMTEEEDRHFREVARPVAEHQIKGLFLLESVQRQQNITVTAEELEARIEAIAAEHGFDLDKYRKYLEQGEEKDRIRQGLLERKTYDFLLSRAEFDQARTDADQGDPAGQPANQPAAGQEES
jgi:trigger factor